MADKTLDTPGGRAGELARRIGRHSWLLLLLGVLLFVLWAGASAWLQPVRAVDIDQHRVNVALPPPTATSQIRQTFTTNRNGFDEVELLLVQNVTAGPGGRLTVELRDAAGRSLVSRTLESQSLAHNQPLSLRFPPQADSAGQSYTLLVSGTEENNASVWAYDLDVLAQGELTLVGGQTTARDLRIVTHYRLTPLAALVELGQLAWGNGALLILSLLFLLMPGCLLLLLAGRWTAGWDVAAWYGAALAAGVATWPLLWQWLTVAGGRWRGWSLWVVLVAGWLLVIGLVVRRLVQRDKAGVKSRAGQGQRLRLHWQHGLLALLLLVALAVRLLAVRDLAFLPWVDASRHALITTLMAERGQTINDYAPLLPIDRFPYHYGFHTLSASLLEMTGLALPQLLLILGQLLNALVPLTIYAGAWLLTRRRNVGLLAAFLVALPFLFPGYYVTWGRMTQLAAVLILPVLIGLTWRLVRGAPRWRPAWWLLAVYIAGLFLIHIRVFLLFLPFVGLVWLASTGRRGRWLALSGLLALVLVSPRLIQLLSRLQPERVLTSFPGYNDFPSGYLDVGWERAFLFLAAALWFWAAISAVQGRRWAWLPLLLGGWVGLTALLLSGNRLGLPESWLLNVSSAYIVLFVPLAWLLAIGLVRLWRWAIERHWLLRSISLALAGVGLAAAFLLGLRQQVTIVNPQTVLALPPDAAGLAWLESQGAPEAKVAVNSWLWLGGTWAGSDGGAWILPLTGQDSTTPPADYMYNEALRESVSTFNSEASTVDDWSQPEAAEWLRRQGVTHVFVGAKGGFFDPSALARNPRLGQAYAENGVFIFTVR
ncbi:MAG: hypothetical protein ACWGPS_05625 [Candidatus Promineifilaceae bacterium]